MKQGHEFLLTSVISGVNALHEAAYFVANEAKQVPAKRIVELYNKWIYARKQLNSAAMLNSDAQDTKWFQALSKVLNREAQQWSDVIERTPAIIIRYASDGTMTSIRRQTQKEIDKEKIDF